MHSLSVKCMEAEHRVNITEPLHHLLVFIHNADWKHNELDTSKNDSNNKSGMELTLLSAREHDRLHQWTCKNPLHRRIVAYVSRSVTEGSHDHGKEVKAWHYSKVSMEMIQRPRIPRNNSLKRTTVKDTQPRVTR